MKKFIPWLCAAIVTTVFFALLYATVQQSQRLGANDPQIQLAQDAATKLNQGASPSTILPAIISIKDSLTPFVIIYDQKGKPVGGSGVIDGNLPVVPFGVLSAAENQAYNAVTWQPQTNIRIASVTVAAHNYFVLSGRSLAEVEKRESKTLLLSLTGWITSLLVLTVGFLLWNRILQKKK